jgi:peroxiredoxin
MTLLHALATLALSTALSMAAATSSPADEPRNAIHPSAETVQPLLPGMKAPAFQVRDAAGRPVSFDPDHLAEPIVLTFFRGGWCPYCNLHLAELRHVQSDLKMMGFDLWFVSIDRPELLYESLEDPDIGYTVLSDADLAATRAFGLAFRLDDDTVERYRGYGVNLEAVAGQNHHVLPAPSTFIIGKDGVIRFAYTNPNYQVRLHPAVLLAAANAYLSDEDQRLQREWEKRRASESDG